MKEIELLDAIGGARDRYLLDAQQCRENQVIRRRSPVKIVLIAAIVAALLAGCAYAVLRLKDLKVKEYSAFGAKQETREAISLQGFAGTPGYMGAKEWLEFEKVYDPDGTLMIAADNAGFIPPEAYMSYNCYTQAMVDKVDEICEKYQLEPIGKYWVERDVGQIFDAIGIRDVTTQSSHIKVDFYSGYYFQNGTFALEGDAQIDGNVISFQMRSVMKKSLDVVYLPVGRIEDYEQWNYTMQDGTQVLLALHPSKALILVDKPDSFVTVNAWIDGDERGHLPVSREMLERFTDSFDFSFQVQSVDRAAAETREQARREADKAERAVWQRESDNPRQSYGDFIRNNITVSEDVTYTLIDLDGDGREELIIGDSKIKLLLSDKTKDTKLLLTGENLDVREDGLVFAISEDETCDTYAFYKVSKGDKTLVDFVLHLKGENDHWERSADGDVLCELVIDEEEARKVIDTYAQSYPRIELDWKPITEFPMN